MIASYVTSHGFGHLNRTAAVLNRIPADVPIAIFGHENLFPNWRERLRRPAELIPHVCDAGAYNPPGDSQTTDGPMTLTLAARVRAEALARVDEDVERLRSIGAKVVLSDAASLPLVYARRAGIPGYLLANFTWADIYRPHARKLGPDALGLVAALAAEYRQATAFLRTEPALAMNGYGVPVEEVGLVVTPGRPRGRELRECLGLGKDKTIVYFYMGRQGQAGMDWGRLERLGRLGYHFAGFHEASVGRIENVHVVDAEAWTGADLAASSDIMVTKAGHGTVGEALANRRPMIYAPRTGFAEHRALDRVLKNWGGGLRASTQAFNAFRLEPLLHRARTLKPPPSPFPTDGAARVSSILVQAIRKAGA